MSGGADVIRAEKLSFSYPADSDSGQLAVPVFEGLDFAVEEGSFTVVLGHNGSGKSTLAKHFNAVLLPTGGTMWVYGMDTKNEDDLIAIRSTVGMVFQNPDNQIVANVVEEDVAFAPENLGVPSAMQPKCIVLDEPTAMLDPQGRREVISTILELNREHGVTVVLITHHMREAIAADRVAVMSDGKIIADGTPADVFSQVELLDHAQLTVPDTTRLLFELRRHGLRLPLSALSVEDCAQAIYAAFSA